jgi:hypothetical protein
LSPNLYSLESHSLSGNKLFIFVSIKGRFNHGTVAIYQHDAATARLLQTGQPQLIGSFAVERFDPLNPSEVEGISVLSVVFGIAAWMAVVLIIPAVMTGYSVVLEDYIISLQVVLLHVYIASDLLPLTFRDSLFGLSPL